MQQYPVNIFGKYFQIFVTCFLPVAFINYYPSVVLLGKAAGGIKMWQYFAPFVAIVMLGIAAAVWTKGLKRYTWNGKLVVLFYARTEETLAIVYIEYNKYSGNISIGLPPDLRIDVLPFGGFYDENEQKESVENIVEIVSHKQTILEREE